MRESPAGFRDRFKGQLVGPDDPEYDQARKVWNAIADRHPALIARFDADLDRMDLTTASHRRLRDAMLSGAPETTRARLAETHRPDLDALMARPHVLIAPPVRNHNDDDMAQSCLTEDFAKLRARRGSRHEVADAMEDINRLADEGLTWRLAQSADAMHRADRPDREDATDLGEDRSALSRSLQNLIDAKVWEKKR